MSRKKVKLRKVTDEEVKEVNRLATSRKAPAREVQRARVIQAMIDNPQLAASEAGQIAGYKQGGSGIHWVKRFNVSGIEGLKDKPRSGRPRTHDESVRGGLIDLALQKPRTLGYPFELWTLERLQQAFEERKGVHLSDSTIWTWLDDEGLEWKRQQTWFHNAESHDPEFVEKRGL